MEGGFSLDFFLTGVQLFCIKHDKSSRFRDQAVAITVVAMVLNSVSIISSDFLPDLIGQVAFSVIFGFTFGCYISSVMVVLSVTMASRTSLTNPLGLILLTAGLSSLVGPLVAGSLFDLTGSHRFL